VEAAQGRAAVDRKLTLPPGSWLEWGGQFENLEAAKQRLEIVVPVCLLLIFAALYVWPWRPAPARRFKNLSRRWSSAGW
jgi:cobalt-zinc-cadmium resistance protein CzcA